MSSTRPISIIFLTVFVSCSPSRLLTKHRTEEVVTSSGKTLLSPQRLLPGSPNTLGWDCLALLQSPDPRAIQKLKSTVEALHALMIRDRKSNQALGWTSFSGMKSDCRKCQGPHQVYAFQTGLGLGCFALSAHKLKRPDLLERSNEIVAHWKTLVNVPPCPGCLYFTISDAPTDAKRFVRNHNVFMGFGLGALGSETNNPALKEMAAGIIKSERWERAQGFKGYLGRKDKLSESRQNFEAMRIENHAAAIAVLVKSLDQLLPELKAEDLALELWRTWAKCDNGPCLKNGCDYWAGNAEKCQTTHTASHCAFRNENPIAEQQCRLYLSKAARLSSYALWAFSLGKDMDKSGGPGGG